MYCLVLVTETRIEMQVCVSVGLRWCMEANRVRRTPALADVGR
jgi:hypothetical protein